MSKKYADLSNTYRSYAEAAANSAAKSVTDIKSSENNAKDSATRALSSEINARASESNAYNYQSNAKASEMSAKESSDNSYNDSQRSEYYSKLAIDLYDKWESTGEIVKASSSSPNKNLKIWKGTQAEYGELSSKDDNTLYITEE